MQYYESKFGAARVRGMIPMMKEVAREHGIEVEYGGFVGNTLDSHVSDILVLRSCDGLLQYLMNGMIFVAHFLLNFAP